MVNLKGFKAYELDPSYQADVPIETQDNIDFKTAKKTLNRTDSFFKVHQPEYEFEEHIANDERYTNDILQKGRDNLISFMKQKIFKQQKHIHEKNIGRTFLNR